MAIFVKSGFWMIIAVCLLCSGCAGFMPLPVEAQTYSVAPALIEKYTDVAPNGVRRPPHLFTLGGLSASQAEALRRVSLVKHVEKSGDRYLVLYQSRTKGAWPTRQEVDAFYSFLAFKGVLGRTRWSHGGEVTSAGGHVFSSVTRLSFGVMFDDAKTGSNELMRINSYPDTPPEQVEHEMLRTISPEHSEVVRCGKGYAIVCRNWGVVTIWQPTPNQFVRIDNSFDKKMVAAYIERLGSIIPKDYKIDGDKWVKNEIRWRLEQLNEYYQIWGSLEDEPRGHKEVGRQLTPSFPEIRTKLGVVKRGDPVKVRWEWLHKVGSWLWANRGNFKFDPKTRGYILKDPDQFDPKMPASLPPELHPPPFPTKTRKYADVLREVESKR